MYIYKIILCLFVIGLSVPMAFGAEREIVLHPSGADVRETLKIQQQNGQISIKLPAGVVEGSLRVTIPGAEVRSMTEQNDARTEMPRLTAARQEWRNAQTRVDELQNSIANLNARLELWLKPSVPGLSQAEDLHRLEASMSERVTALMAERASLLPALDAARREAGRLAGVVRDMLPATGDAPAPVFVQQSAQASEPSPAAELIVSGPHEQGMAGKTALVRVVPAKADQALPAELDVTLNYRLEHCGWTPRYALEALTAENVVTVRREAVINQRTGEDWEGASLRLSTLPPSANEEPVELRPWLMRPQGPLMQQAKERMVAAPAAMDSANLAAFSAAPARSEEAASAVWELGAYTVLSGQPQQIVLDNQRWKADFYRLLRPSVRKVAWLMATVSLPAPQMFEAAEADLYVDSRHLGRTRFSFAGNSGELSFGQDQAVTASMEQDSNQSGESGFLSKNRTRAWVWTIKVRNAHAFPVAARVEDPAPQVGDERIELRMESQPRPERTGHTLSWKLNLKPGEEMVIRHKASFAAPDDMLVHPGR